MFYVDDNFAASDPVMRMPRTRRAAAVGLWTLAGTWSARFLKDGFVPAHMVDEWGPIEDAELLVEVGLWRRRRAGWQFADWPKWQKTRAQVETYRAAERERKAAARSGKKTKPAASPEIPGAVPAGQDADSALPHPHPHPSPEPDDDRLTPPDEPTSQQKRARASSPQPGDSPVEFDLDAVARALVTVADHFDPDDHELLHGRAEIAGRHLLAKGGARVKHPTPYIVRSIERDPAAWAAFAYRGELP